MKRHFLLFIVGSLACVSMVFYPFTHYVNVAIETGLATLAFTLGAIWIKEAKPMLHIWAIITGIAFVVAITHLL